MRLSTQSSLAQASKDDSDVHVRFLANFRDRQPDSRPSSDLSSSLAPSQSASQSGHPDYSSQGHSSISSPVNMLLAPPEAHPENDILNEPTQTQYRLSLPAAHALTDEDQHNYVPSRIDLPPPVPAHRPSPVIEDDELDGSSAGEESDERMYEVHENAQFSTPENRRPEAKTRGSGSTVRLPLLRQHAKKAATDESDRHSILPASISAPLPVLPSSLTPAQSQKIDPYGNLTGSNRGHMDDLDGSPRQRKWSSIFSGLFHKRGRTMSMSTSAGAGHSSLSTDGGGWRTRTDRNLKMVGRADDSSDEEDARRLPALSSAAIDYDALRQKSLVEAKTLPNPGPSGSHLRESSETASTKSSPGMKGQQGRKKLRKTADTVRKRNASAVDISSRSLDTSDISSRAVKGGLKPSQANDSSDRTTRRQTISDIPKQAIPPHVRALQTGGETSSASVTRSSTITSIASSTRSAPTNRAASLDVPPSQLKATKRGSGTWSDGGRPGVNGMSTAKGTPPRMGHTRTGSQGGQVQLGGTAAGRGQASLMSIVEGVSQQNRRGWGQTNPDSLLFQAKAPGAVTNASPSTSLPFNAVQPPPRLSSSSSLDDHSPRSGVVGKRRILTSAAAQNADLRRLSTISASSSEPSLPLKGTSSITTPTPSHTRPVMAQKVPLRSAMRNHSSSPKNSSGTSTPRSASPVRFSGKTTTAPPLAETTETARQAHPGALRLATSQANGIVKDDDSASIASSYETGREDFDDDAMESPPTPPPHDPMPAPAHALRALPAGLVSGLKTNGTQTSSSMSGGTATPPSRRKSVRVSLQPTFSPTPPATYDDEEDHHPWGDTRPQQQPGSWKTRAEPAEDVWDNSSDEDEDYSRAKQMLHSASKKLEKTAHMTGLK